MRVCVRKREKTELARSMFRESLKGHHTERERELATERQDILNKLILQYRYLHQEIKAPPLTLSLSLSLSASVSLAG